MPASGWDNAERIYNVNPNDYNVVTIPIRAGIIINESDDGDDGFLMILNPNKIK